jgi:hypothetical protein
LYISLQIHHILLHSDVGDMCILDEGKVHLFLVASLLLNIDIILYRSNGYLTIAHYKLINDLEGQDQYDNTEVKCFVTF